MLTTAEVAARLGLAQVTIRTHIKDGNLAARRATQEEAIALLATGRIKAIPVAGVNVIDDVEFERFQREKRKPGRQFKITP